MHSACHFGQTLPATGEYCYIVLQPHGGLHPCTFVLFLPVKVPAVYCFAMYNYSIMISWYHDLHGHSIHFKVVLFVCTSQQQHAA